MFSNCIFAMSGVVVWMGSTKKVIWKTFQSAQENNGEKEFFKIQRANGKDSRTNVFPWIWGSFLEILLLSTNLLFRRNVVSKNYSDFRSNHRWCYIKKGFLKNFANFTGKYLFQSKFLVTRFVTFAVYHHLFVY